MIRFILCRLLDCHAWQRWEADGNYSTCARCDMSATSVTQ